MMKKLSTKDFFFLLVMGRIENFCLRHSSSSTHFLCWQGIWVHNSGKRWDRKVLFSIINIVFYSPHNQTKTKTIGDKQFRCSKFSANLTDSRCSKFSANLTVFRCSKFSANLAIFCCSNFSTNFVNKRLRP